MKAIAVQTTIHLYCLQYDSCDKNDDCEKTECCIEESNFWIASKRDLPPPDIEIASPFGNNPKRGEVIERLVVVECWPLLEDKKNSISSKTRTVNSLPGITFSPPHKKYHRQTVVQWALLHGSKFYYLGHFKHSLFYFGRKMCQVHNRG